jgi:hypothetical protein
MSDGRRDSTSLEDATIGLLRKARYTCEHMGQVGIRAAALADWLEVQVPLVSARCRRVVRTALNEISGGGIPEERD